MREINGFTLIELLIVIVVLGILAAVVIFALGGITGKSALAACQADGATVTTAMSAFGAENPGVTITTSTDLLPGAVGVSGGPYISSWPSNGTNYEYSIDAGGTLSVSGELLAAGEAYTGPKSCVDVVKTS